MRTVFVHRTSGTGFLLHSTAVRRSCHNCFRGSSLPLFGVLSRKFEFSPFNSADIGYFGAGVTPHLPRTWHVTRHQVIHFLELVVHKETSVTFICPVTLFILADNRNFESVLLNKSQTLSGGTRYTALAERE